MYWLLGWDYCLPSIVIDLHNQKLYVTLESFVIELLE